jgi:Ni,Fe-hydrogenase III small subunit
MATMTWNEFKNFVDEQLLEQGICDDLEIEYIDISTPDLDLEMFTPEVTIDCDKISIL